MNYITYPMAFSHFSKVIPAEVSKGIWERIAERITDKLHV